MKLVKKIKSDEYYLLLFTQLVFFGTVPLLTPYLTSSNIIISVALSMVLMAGLNAIQAKRFYVRLGLAVSVLFILTTSLFRFEANPFAVLAAFTCFIIFCIFIIYHIINVLLSTQEIKASLIAGGLAGYLMIGVMLSFFFIMLEAFDSNALSATLQVEGFTGFVYFSLITMTTVGYGDIVPLHPVAQITSAFAAIFSQFYLAVVVAVIVGKIINGHSAK